MEISNWSTDDLPQRVFPPEVQAAMEETAKIAKQA